jgi:hypothetical protein
MDKSLFALNLAKEQLEAAEHMISVTLGVVGDPRLLLTVAQKLHAAHCNAMKSILYYEVHNNKIPKFDENFERMLALFQARAARRYNLQENYTPFIKQLNGIIQGHKDSPVVFERKGSYVICDEDYNMEQVSQERLQEYVKIGRKFIEDAERMVVGHGRRNITRCI